MIVTDYVLSSIEKALLKNPAIYNYIEECKKRFSQLQEYNAGDKRMRQMTKFEKDRSKSINEAYLDTSRTKTLHYQKFGLNEVNVYRNGLPIAGTLISTADNKRVYYNTHKAIDFVLNTSHEISFAN